MYLYHIVVLYSNTLFSTVLRYLKIYVNAIAMSELNIHSRDRGGKRAMTEKKVKDPELEAEILYAKQNGFDPPQTLPHDAIRSMVVDAFVDNSGTNHAFKYEDLNTGST